MTPWRGKERRTKLGELVHRCKYIHMYIQHTATCRYVFTYTHVDTYTQYLMGPCTWKREKPKHFLNFLPVAEGGTAPIFSQRVSDPEPQTQRAAEGQTLRSASVGCASNLAWEGREDSARTGLYIDLVCV